MRVPVVPNPTVESTDIIDELTGAPSRDIVLPGMVNTPSIKSPDNKLLIGV